MAEMCGVCEMAVDGTISSIPNGTSSSYPITIERSRCKFCHKCGGTLNVLSQEDFTNRAIHKSCATALYGKNFQELYFKAISNGVFYAEISGNL